jgi:hypothetical protein
MARDAEASPETYPTYFKYALKNTQEFWTLFYRSPVKDDRGCLLGLRGCPAGI